MRRAGPYMRPHPTRLLLMCAELEKSPPPQMLAPIISHDVVRWASEWMIAYKLLRTALCRSQKDFQLWRICCCPGWFLTGQDIPQKIGWI